MAKLEYEALVKIEDNVNPSLPPEKQGALWKAGDIVVIRPKGWVWGRMEVKHFLIVNLGFLEESDVEALLEGVTVNYEETDMTEHKELIARKRYRLNVTALLDNLPAKTQDDVFDRDIESQPLRQSVIKSSDIEDITLRPEIQQAINNRKAVLREARAEGVALASPKAVEAPVHSSAQRTANEKD